MFGIKIKLPKIKLPKIIKQAATLVKPFAGTAVLMVPGGAQAMAGLQVADTVVKAVNSKDPVKKKKAVRMLKAQAHVAMKHPNPVVRQQAAHGITLMNKRAAMLRSAKKFRVDARGIVRKVGAHPAQKHVLGRVAIVKHPPAHKVSR